jgi:cephalosporin hydroxylase
MRETCRRLQRSAAAGLLLLGGLGCGAAEEEAPQTNLEIYRAAQQQPLDPGDEDPRLGAFRDLWGEHMPVFRSRFLGVRTLQNPMDAWVIQEIITEVAPDYIVETGTYQGGSAALWALILENVNPDGRVITIDIEDQRDPAAVALAISQRRVDFLVGSSTAPEIVAEVERRVRGGRVLVILDSLHSKEHVADELAAYAPLVPVGSYVIVQDTPVGPIHAIDEFLAANDTFVADRERERFLLTNTQRGYLRRARP